MMLARLAGRALFADGAIRPAEIAIEEGRMAAVASVEERWMNPSSSCPASSICTATPSSVSSCRGQVCLFPSVPALVETDR